MTESDNAPAKRPAEAEPVSAHTVADAATRAARLEEFKILRGEIELRASEQRTMERYVMLADAAIYSALVFPRAGQAPGDLPLVSFAWVLPPIIGFLALIRWRESVMMIETLAEFLRQREKELFGEKGSWEWFLFTEKRKGGTVGMFSFWYVAYWMIVVGGTGALACYKFFDGDDRRVPLTVATGVGLAAVSYIVVRRSRPIAAIRSWMARTRS